MSPDIAEFARQAKRSKPRCLTCKLKGEIWDAICELDEVIEAGELRQTFPAVHEYLVKHYGYPFSMAAFYYHAVRRRCGQEERKRRAS